MVWQKGPRPDVSAILLILRDNFDLDQEVPAVVLNREVMQGQCGFVADLLEREARLYAGDAGYPRQMSLQELFVRREVRYDDAQQVIGLAGHQIAFQHLGALPDGGLEGVEPFLDLLLQGDADEDVDRQIDQRRIDQRHIGPDHSALLPRLDAPQAGRA